MNYIECSFEIEPFEPYAEILLAELSELPFESFLEETPFLKAYIPVKDFSKKEVVNCWLFSSDDVKIKWNYKEIPQENWNKKWETSFDAVEIDDFCRIRAPFHNSKQEFTHEIIIEPKMSFGTGHHETTQLMIQGISQLDLTNKKVLDMGSGTAILSILAEKMGAEAVDAIDIEEWAYENMKENIQRNNCTKIKVYQGGEEQIFQLDDKYNCILANINKNILLKQIPTYIKHLKKGGDLLLSGFFPSDVDDFQYFVKSSLLIEIAVESNDQWCMLHLRKLN